MTLWTFLKAISPTTWAPAPKGHPWPGELAWAVSTPRAEPRRWAGAGGHLSGPSRQGSALFDCLSALTPRHTPATVRRHDLKCICLRPFAEVPLQDPEDGEAHAEAKACAACASRGRVPGVGRFHLHHGEHDLLGLSSSASSSSHPPTPFRLERRESHRLSSIHGARAA